MTYFGAVVHDTCVVVGHIVCVDLCCFVPPKVVFLVSFDVIGIDGYIIITVWPCVLVENSQSMHELMNHYFFLK